MEEEDDIHPVEDDRNLREIADEVFPEYTGVNEESTVWLSMGVWVDDSEGEIDPDKLESRLYDWFKQFFEKGLFSYSSEGPVDISPAQGGSWSENELVVRYKAESYMPFHEDARRGVGLWLPVADGFDWFALHSLHKSAEELLEEHGEKIPGEDYDVRGPAVFGSTEKASEMINMLESDAEDVREMVEEYQ